jgi:kumamolisin
MENTKKIAIPGSERFARPGTHITGTPDPNEQIDLSLLLRPRKPLADVASSKELTGNKIGQRKYLTRRQFASTYGADPRDVAKVEAFAHEYNLTIKDISLPRRTVTLSGTASALSSAFDVKLAQYQHPDGTNYRGRTGAIFVPADLAGVVQGVFGFDNRRQATAHFRVKGANNVARAAAPAGYTPIQVAELYDFPARADGSGETIGILEFGGGYSSTDLSTYFQNMGLNSPRIAAIAVDGVTNTPQPGANSPDVEVALDIEVAGSIAPGASIAVYFAPFTERGWVDSITTAVHDSVHNPSVLSISWGFAEGKLIWSAQAVQAVNEAFAAAAAMGISVCVASGDDGSRDDVNDGQTHVDFPASSALVLACGGTTLQSASGKISSETVWNDGPKGGATGGGVSVDIPLPAWQANANVPDSVNPGHQAGRGVPDVAGNADPNTGYHVLADGKESIVGGTSAVAPLWAGLIARLNQQLKKPLGFVNPLIYSNVQSAGALHDITSGNNDITGKLGGYAAGKGWDACTGYGSPDGSAIASALNGHAAAVAARRKQKVPA